MCPRRPEPRSAVPGGAVGIAGEFTGVYPRSSPGGWQLIGTALVEMWVDHLESRGERLPPSLRLMLMSGDWIPVSLPDRIRGYGPVKEKSVQDAKARYAQLATDLVNPPPAPRQLAAE